MFFSLCICVGIILSGCNPEKSFTSPARDSSEKESHYKSTECEGSTESSKTSSDALAFEVQIDKDSLQNKKVQKTTAIIFTESTDWEYNVEAECGKISNIGKNTFDYTAPKNEKEDTITVQISDNQKGTQYKWVIPLVFSNLSKKPVLPVV